MKQRSLISESFNNLFLKLDSLDIGNLDISEYNRDALKRYINNFSFYICLYSQLMQKALNKLNKPLHESTFVDYGGGCGILSLLAKEIGFKNVIYNDINKASLSDATIIAGHLGTSIDYYIYGDAEEFCKEINVNNIKPDLICSFDVLEHIYDLKLWFRTIATINCEFSLLFMTSANSRNPYISNRLKKLHIKSEYEGGENNIRQNNIFLSISFLEERKSIIKSNFPELDYKEVDLLSNKTRGLRKDDIVKVVNDYIKTGCVNYEINHPTNTCDPYTGSWTEKLIDIKQLKAYGKNNNFKVDISNSLYAYSGNILLSLSKYILNQLIKVSGHRNLFLSPTITLEIEKT
jgi:hypothetical protein